MGVVSIADGSVIVKQSVLWQTYQSVFPVQTFNIPVSCPIVHRHAII